MASQQQAYIAALVTIVALVATACSSGSGRQTEVPEIPGEIQETVSTAPAVVAASCRLAFGEGQGAEVVAITPGVPAEASVQLGDVITQFGGQPIESAAELIDEVRLRAVGDVVPSEVDRNGDTLVVELPLIERTDEEGVAMIGIAVTTAVDLVELDELVFATPSIDDQLARVVSLGELLVVLDPVQASWEKLPVPPPTTPWTPARGDIFILEEAAEGESATIVPLLESLAPIEFQAGRWEARWLIGTAGDNVLVLADQDVDGELAAGLFSIDPVSGSLVWSWLPGNDEAGRPLVPVLAIANPSRNRTLVALTALVETEGSSQSLAFVVLDANGEPQRFRTPVEGALPFDAVPIGWSGETTIAYVAAERDRLLRWNIETGTVNEVLLPMEEIPPLIIPVGDGTHYIVAADGSIDLVAGGGFSRPLATGCDADRISGLGWGIAA